MVAPEVAGVRDLEFEIPQGGFRGPDDGRVLCRRLVRSEDAFFQTVINESIILRRTPSFGEARLEERKRRVVKLVELVMVKLVHGRRLEPFQDGIAGKVVGHGFYYTRWPAFLI